MSSSSSSYVRATAFASPVYAPPRRGRAACACSAAATTAVSAPALWATTANAAALPSGPVPHRAAPPSVAGWPRAHARGAPGVTPPPDGGPEDDDSSSRRQPLRSEAHRWPATSGAATAASSQQQPPPPPTPAQPPTPPPHRPGRAPRAPDYYPNVGSVIEHLRADYPHLLEREPDMSVYTENIVFTERSTGYAVVGKHAYRNLLWALRVQFKLFFASTSVAIHSLYHDDGAGVIYLRWRIQSTPRVYGLMRHPPTVVFDAMSVYKLGASGFVCEHDLDNSAPVRPRLQPLIEDILSLGTIRIPGRSEPAGAGVGSCRSAARSARMQSVSMDAENSRPSSVSKDWSVARRPASWFASYGKARDRPFEGNDVRPSDTDTQPLSTC